MELAVRRHLVRASTLKGSKQENTARDLWIVDRGTKKALSGAPRWLR